MSVQFPFLENSLTGTNRRKNNRPRFGNLDFERNRGLSPNFQKQQTTGMNAQRFDPGGVLSSMSSPFSQGLSTLQNQGSRFGQGLFNQGSMTTGFGQGLFQNTGSMFGGLGSMFESSNTFSNQLRQRREQERELARQAEEAANNQQGQPGMSTGQVTDGPGRTGEWSSMINAAAEHHGMPADVIMSIMMIETQGVNTKGPMTSYGTPAFGLMQVMPNWHAGRTTAYGGTGSAEDLMDPYMNIMVGSEILKEHYDRAMRERPGISEEQAWNIAAGAYFSGWHGQSTDTDVLGTSTTEYIDMFNQHLQTIRQANPQQSSVNLPGAQEGTVSTIFGGQPYRITQRYGDTTFSQSSGWYGDIGHPGIDVGVPQGTQMYAPISGTVIHAGLNGGYGGTVTIQTEWGTLMLTHLSGIDVQVGQQIQTGMGIGLSGGTEGTWGAGTSTGPHVHIEARDHNGNPFDPTGVLQF